MNFTKLKIFYALIFILACNPSEEKKEDIKELKLKISPIAIEIDTLGKYSYEVFTFKNQENLKFITYNNTTHSIEFYDLKSKKLSKRIFLEADGPKAIGNVQGLYYHNQDSIFIYSRGIINIINESYSKEANPNLFSLIENYDFKFEPFFNHHFRLYYIPEIKSIPLSNKYFDPQLKISPEKEQISLFDISNFKIKPLPYFQTEPTASDFEYGFLNYSTISQPFNGNFFINQVYSPITYQFLLNSENLHEVINANKIHHKKNKNPENWEPHAVESNFYNQLEKLNDSTFVRFVWNGTEYNPKENGFLKKELTLQVFDEDFNLIKEFNLAKNTYYLYSWFVAQSKIYLQIDHPKNLEISESKLLLHEIELVSI
ncbi:DUF4221 family protein [Marivirga sp.]|uniref:DUF4221 family protein n=1 Tax=Marivirga sp. TaxID=2018662 RepID=UPI003DA716CD